MFCRNEQHYLRVGEVIIAESGDNVRIDFTSQFFQTLTIVVQYSILCVILNGDALALAIIIVILST